MIKAVTVTNHLGESLKMELYHPERTGLLISNIEGLGAVTANINTTNVARMDGALFNSARLGTRNIVMTIAFLFNPLIEDSRQLTYRYFPTKKRIKLEFETDNRTSYCYGYVESNEPEIFSEFETCQISIICMDPYFYKSGDSESHTLRGAGAEFEFPFSNESLSESLIVMGEYMDTEENMTNIYYNGETEIGVTIDIYAHGEIQNIMLYNTVSQEQMKINTGKILSLTGQSFGNGDHIIIDTVPGEKSIYLIRNNVYTNIISALDKNSDWFLLYNGDNTFSMTADSGTATYADISFYYREAFLGV